MKKTKEELEAKKANHEAKIVKINKKIKGLKPVDGFYLDKDCPRWMFYKINGMFEFGLNSADRWSEPEPFITQFAEREYLATPKEVTKRLTKFVNSRGYKKGVRIDSYGNDSTRLITSDEVVFKDKSSNDTKFSMISLGVNIIWRSDKGWAKIVEEKPKYTVERWKSNKVIIYKDNIPMCDSELDDINKRIETFLNQ